MYHPANVYHEEGFFKFAGNSRELGSVTIASQTFDEVLAVAHFKDTTKREIGDRISAVIAELGAKRLL